MFKYYIITCFFIIILACGGSEKSEVAKGPKIDGEKLFKMNCVLCHGEDGKLGLNNSKDLSLSELTIEERIEMVTNGKNLMTGFSALLDKDQIKAVAEYTLTLKKK